MALYKDVNGETIQLSSEEEAEVRAEWAKNAETKAARQNIGVIKQQISKRMRELAIEDLKAKGEIPADYEE